MIPTVGCPEILVLAVGNQLLSDDGVGMVLLQELARDPRFGDRVEFVDGGTQGLALMGLLNGRKAVVLLDAISLRAFPGTVHTLSVGQDGILRVIVNRAPSTSHESSALDLLRYAALLGDLPEEVRIIGIEPETVSTGIGLSPSVTAAIPRAVRMIKDLISALISSLEKETQYVSCCAG